MFGAKMNGGNIAGVAHPLEFGLGLAKLMADQITATGLGNSNIDLGTVLAFPHGSRAHCCAFLGRVQPWLLDADHYYVALGSGKLSADPFLRFLTDIFCNGPPTVREAVFLTTWTIQHFIDTNPGGVASPIRIAVLENANGHLAARELPPDEIEEHQQAMESAAEALRRWRDELQSGQAAAGIPQPTAACSCRRYFVKCWLAVGSTLILKRASVSRRSGEWSDDDFNVLADGTVVGRILRVHAAPVGSPWMWTLAFGHHGYEPTREAAMAAFAKSWRREQFEDSEGPLSEGKPDVEQISAKDRVRPQAVFGSIHRTCLSP